MKQPLTSSQRALRGPPPPPLSKVLLSLLQGTSRSAALCRLPLCKYTGGLVKPCCEVVSKYVNCLPPRTNLERCLPSLRPDRRPWPAALLRPEGSALEECKGVQ